MADGLAVCAIAVLIRPSNAAHATIATRISILRKLVFPNAMYIKDALYSHRSRSGSKLFDHVRRRIAVMSSIP